MGNTWKINASKTKENEGFRIISWWSKYNRYHINRVEILETLEPTAQWVSIYAKQTLHNYIYYYAPHLIGRRLSYAQLDRN